MRRPLPVLVGTAVLATAAFADAAPLLRGGPLPDPSVVAACRGVQGPSMVWRNGSIVPAALTAEESRNAVQVPLPGREVYVVAGHKVRVPPSVFSGTGVFRPSPPSAAARADAGWCAGSYREDAGTNFAGS